MHAPRLPRIGLHAAWTDAARRLAAAGVPPEAVDWGLEGAEGAFFDAGLPGPAPAGALRVPRRFPALAQALTAERTGEGMALAYALLLRMQGDPTILADTADAQVARAARIAKAIRRDIHKMHAFVRFQEVGAAEGSAAGGRRAFAAWFEPDHRIEEAVAPFFANRFGDMDWRIVTPEVTITFRDGHLDLVARAAARPDLGDPLEALWTTYFSNIFNPARLKVDAMRAEMPKKYWRNLPEARAIPDLIATARTRTRRMQEAGPTQPAPAALRRRQPEDAPMSSQSDLFGRQTLPEIAREAAACTRCPLHADATQVVFGEGPPDARVMVVGEQPGDREDLAGRPFVGPAGQLFDEVAARAGLDRGTCYVTNAVKHFKFVQKGKRRIHQKPAASEITACNWWLGQELSQVDPELVVAMGATALHSLTGKGQGILKRRGTVEETRDGRPMLITVHPSYLLRLPDAAMRERETEIFCEDLARIPELLGNRAA